MPALQPHVVYSACVHYRPSTLEAWLAHWELEGDDRMVRMLRSFGLEAPLHAMKLEEPHHRCVAELLGHDAELERRWRAALAHVRHLHQSTSAYDALGSSSLLLWLEFWRLERLLDKMESALKIRNRDDVLVVDATVAAEKTGMRPLEARRWRRALALLRDGTSRKVTSLNSCGLFVSLTQATPAGAGDWLEYVCPVTFDMAEKF
jgi:hypothetical protein